MRKCGMSLDRAMSTMKSRRPEISPIPAFLEQLSKYEVKCKQLGAIKSEGESGTVEARSTGNRPTEIGPARPLSKGPSKPSAANGDVCARASSIMGGMKRSIGPAIGPFLPNKIVASELAPSSFELIGPTLPPLTSFKTRDNTKDEKDQVEKELEEASIPVSTPGEHPTKRARTT